jgi:hypothetical protein
MHALRMAGCSSSAAAHLVQTRMHAAVGREADEVHGALLKRRLDVLPAVTRENGALVQRDVHKPRPCRLYVSAGPTSRTRGALRAVCGPWSTTCPEPSALWPTSEFPMSASEGSPTAVPWA